MIATETPKASRMPATEMGVKEAEEITAAIKNGFDNLGAKLLEARERKAYKALGYRSFESYCLTEFGKSTSSAYRIIENQKVISELEAEVARQYDEPVSLKITGPQAQLLKKLPEVGSRLQAIEFAQKLAKSEERNPTTKHLELAVYRLSNKPENYRGAIQKNFSKGVRVEALNTPKTSRGTVRKVDKLGQIYVELDDSGVKPVCFEAHELRVLKDSEKPSTPLNDSIANKGDRVVLFAKGLEGRQGEIDTYKTGKKALVVLDGVTLPIDVAYAELELVKETSNTNSCKDKNWGENLVWESGKNIYYYFPDEDKLYSNRWPTGLTLTPYSHRGTPAEFVKNWEERFAGQVVESLIKDSDLSSLLIAQLIALPEQEKESFVNNLFKNLAQLLPTNHAKLESAVDTDAEVEIEKLRRQNQELQEQLVEAESVIVEMVKLCRSQRQELQEQLVEAESVIVEMVKLCRSQRQELQEQLVEAESVITEMVELCQGGIELTQSPQNQSDHPPLHSEEKYFTAITLHQPWASETDGQLNLLDWLEKEPPEPDDYESIEQFDAAYKQWEDSQQSTAKLEYFCSECKIWMSRNQIKEEFFGEYQTQVCKSCLTEVCHEFDIRSPQLEIEGQKLCNTLMHGSICVPALEPAFPMPESNCGEEVLITSANGTNTATQFSEEDTQIANVNLATSERDTAVPTDLPIETDSWEILKSNNFTSVPYKTEGSFKGYWREWKIFLHTLNGKVTAVDIANEKDEMAACTDFSLIDSTVNLEDEEEIIKWAKEIISDVINVRGERDRQLKILEKIELTHRRIKLTEEDLKSAHKIADKKKLKQEIKRLGQRLEDLSFFATLRIGQKICHRLNNYQGQIFALCFYDGGMPHAGIEWEIYGGKSKIYEPMFDLTTRITGLDIRE